MYIYRCPQCNGSTFDARVHQHGFAPRDIRFYPKGTPREPLSAHVDAAFAIDYNEAEITLPLSPKASAALSRRCLQHLIREKLGVTKKDLASEIDEVIKQKNLPSAVLESLDAVRVIGNFAAHPMKSTSTGEIIDVEPGEAEWNLDVLDGLFDYIFVQPEILKAKMIELNKKLADAGKPPLKVPGSDPTSAT